MEQVLCCLRSCTMILMANFRIRQKSSVSLGPLPPGIGERSVAISPEHAGRVCIADMPDRCRVRQWLYVKFGSYYKRAGSGYEKPWGYAVTLKLQVLAYTD